MRNIYHELGKRQSDIHALSLALAQTTAEKKSLQEENSSLKGTIKAHAEEMSRLRQENERVMEGSLRDADDKSEL
jgi:predicted nuclease with TOPRIM domain